MFSNGLKMQRVMDMPTASLSSWTAHDIFNMGSGTVMCQHLHSPNFF